MPNCVRRAEGPEWDRPQASTDRQYTLRWANWTAGEPTATAAEVANHAVVHRLGNSLPSPNLPISELQRRRCCKHACIHASMVYTPSITTRLGCRCAHHYQPWILMRGAVVLCCVRRAKICLGHSTDSATSQSQGDAQRAHEPPWLERLLGCSKATCCRRQQGIPSYATAVLLGQSARGVGL